VYASTSFARKEADYEKLGKWTDMLNKLREVDPRGAFFTQEDGQEALKVCVDAKMLATTIRVFAEKRGVDHDEYIALIALKLRVMLVHERWRTPPVVVKTEKDARKKARLHPFVAFRRQEDDDTDGQSCIEEEAAFLVTRLFDASKMQAMAHYSDGQMVAAKSYNAGPHGMIVATWADGSSMELELPNARLGEDSLLPTPPALGHATKDREEKKQMHRGRILKRPAAVKIEPEAAKPDEVADEKDEDEKSEKDEDEKGSDDEPLVKARWSIKPGHDGAVCLFLVGVSSRDKAQIVQVSPAQLPIRLWKTLQRLFRPSRMR